MFGFLPLLQMVQDEVGEKEGQDKDAQHFSCYSRGDNYSRQYCMHGLVCQALALHLSETFRDRLLSSPGALKLSEFLLRFEGFCVNSSSHLPSYFSLCLDWTLLIPVLI